MRFLLALAITLAALSGRAQTAAYAALGGIDTLTNQDTVTAYLATNCVNVYSLDLIVRITNVSGTTSGTLYLEVANPSTPFAANTATSWFPAYSQSISGAGTTLYRFTVPEITARRVRLLAITPSGSRVLAIGYEGLLKKRS